MAFTYFFRDFQTLDMIREHVLPTIGTRRYINIWSAGCAMGQEPYTVAILLRENMGAMIFRNVKIFATDIDSSNLFGKIITDGIYPKEELQRIPPNIFAEYFSPDPLNQGKCIISEEIRKRVEFHRHNLLSFTPIRTSLALIICKNVLLHFTEEERIKVYRMFHEALDDIGYLITEQTQKLPPEVSHLFTPVVMNAQVYRKV